MSSVQSPGQTVKKRRAMRSIAVFLLLGASVASLFVDSLGQLLDDQEAAAVATKHESQLMRSLIRALDEINLDSTAVPIERSEILVYSLPNKITRLQGNKEKAFRVKQDEILPIPSLVDDNDHVRSDGDFNLIDDDDEDFITLRLPTDKRHVLLTIDQHDFSRFIRDPPHKTKKRQIGSGASFGGGNTHNRSPSGPVNPNIPPSSVGNSYQTPRALPFTTTSIPIGVGVRPNPTTTAPIGGDVDSNSPWIPLPPPWWIQPNTTTTTTTTTTLPPTPPPKLVFHFPQCPWWCRSVFAHADDASDVE